MFSKIKSYVETNKAQIQKTALVVGSVVAGLLVGAGATYLLTNVTTESETEMATQELEQIDVVETPAE